jgi:hypothetical protein
MKKIFALSTALLAFLALSLFSFAEGAPIDSGDTPWILVSSAMVFFKTPGLAFFYAGFFATLPLSSPADDDPHFKSIYFSP